MLVTFNKSFLMFCSLKMAIMMALDLKSKFLELCDFVKGKIDTSSFITRPVSFATKQGVSDNTQ